MMKITQVNNDIIAFLVILQETTKLCKLLDLLYKVLAHMYL